MLFYGIFTICLVVGLAGWYRIPRTRESSYDTDTKAVFGSIAVAAAIGLGIVLALGLIATGIVIHWQVYLVKAERHLGVAEKQYEQQIIVIRQMAAKYPLEEKLLKELNPALLLKLPEIQSDKVLIKELELALKYKDRIYKILYEKNEMKRHLDFHSYRWFSPTWIAPKYEN